MGSASAPLLLEGVAPSTGLLGADGAGDARDRYPALDSEGDPVSALVFSCRGSDVRDVIVDGEVLVRGGRVAASVLVQAGDGWHHPPKAGFQLRP